MVVLDVRGENEGGGWNGMTNLSRGFGLSGASSSPSPSLGLYEVEVDVML